MTPDPSFLPRYADILQEPANEDLAEIVQALDDHFHIASLPASLSRAPIATEPSLRSAILSTPHQTMKGPLPMAKQSINLNQHRGENGRGSVPVASGAARRSYPLIATLVIVLFAGGFFGVQALRQHQSGAGTPGAHPTATNTAAPLGFLRLAENTNPVITRIAATPITSLVVGSGDNLISVQVHLDATQTKPGDKVTAIWQVAGTPLGGTECCQWQIVAHDPYADGFNFTASLTNAGAGSVKVSYNGKLAYTVTFTIASYNSPLTVPPTAIATPTVTAAG